MLNSKSGLGQNARHSIAALELAGWNVEAVPVSVHDRTVTEAAPAGFVLSQDRARINLWHVNPDNLPEAVALFEPAMYHGCYNVGSFAWELDRHPEAHRLAIDWVDEIWVPSEYCAAGFRRYT